MDAEIVVDPAEIARYARTFGRVPSRYQANVFQFIERGRGDGVVEAVAGSGKTTTLVWGAQLISGSAIFVAFNKSIAEELEGRLRGTSMTARTIHSMGYSAVAKATGKRRLEVKGGKYRALAADLVDALLITYQPRQGEEIPRRDLLVHALAQLVDKVRLTLTDHQDEAALGELAAQFSIEVWPPALRLIPWLLERGEERARKYGEIDYTDMIWLVARWNLALPTFSWVFVDECQDLSRCQLELVLKLRARGGRMLFVGDKRQCQPAGTMVRMADGSERPIEKIMAGKQVVTYDRRSASFVKQGLVSATGSRWYVGPMYTVAAGGKTTCCTDNHKWLVRWVNTPDEAYVTYLMRRGTRFRVGMTKMFLKNASGLHFGLASRVRQERADAAWVLQVHNNLSEALSYEQVVSTEYGLPQVVFNSFDGIRHYTQPVIDAISESLSDQLPRAARCLEAHGRRIEYPLYRRSGEEGERQRQGRNTLFVTEACNLLDGFMAVVVAPEQGSSNDRAADWQPITVTTQMYSGLVYSLDVAKHELYVADGLLTHNSIYAFAGADAHSFQNIIERTSATVLPLSICYRCPAAHVRLVQAIVPQIEAAPGAAPGVLTWVSRDDVLTMIREGDAVISRLTAPVVRLCIKLIGQGVPARVRGRDIGEQLQNLVRDIAKLDGFQFREFYRWAEQYRTLQTYNLTQKARDEEQAERMISAMNDRLDGILACYEGFGHAERHAAIQAGQQPEGEADGVEALCREIDGLFADGRISVELMTIHKAKGLEFNRVFVWDWDKLPMTFSKQSAEQAQQEAHLKYVAGTRSKHTLYLVSSKPLPKAPPAEAPAQPAEAPAQPAEVALPVAA